MPPQADELGRLMQAAQAGDADAYLALLQAITPRLRQLIIQQRGFAGPDTVEDLLQDVLLSLHAVRATYDPQRPFMPWLYAILRNRLADGARRHARIAAREVPVEDLDVTFQRTGTNPDSKTYGDVERLQRAVRLLPIGQRRAIRLLKLQELSLKEASAISGQSVGALKVATHRAITALRRALGVNK